MFDCEDKSGTSITLFTSEVQEQQFLKFTQIVLRHIHTQTLMQIEKLSDR